MLKENDNLKIVSVKEILREKLDIPGYQRPYRWTTEAAAMLVNDTLQAFHNKIPEYRIGSVVLHRDVDKLHIVDGQQRLTTLSILIFCFAQRLKNEDYTKHIQLLNAKYNDLSEAAILNNYEVIRNKIDEIDDVYINGYVDYLLNKCTLVKIITDCEQEAFQFFDSQNSRGKTLAPHDLLKSYHLREMNDELENEKVSIINDWENTKQKELAVFFENHLYPLVKWYKSLDGLNYSSKEIRTFKGIKKSNNYNFSIYHRSANLYIEKFNRERMYELIYGAKLNQFQLTQPLIAGRRFFQYTLHYFKMYKDLEELFRFKFSEEDIPDGGSGDRYIKNLFHNVVMFFVDKFGIEALTDARLLKLYKWSYSLRLVMKAVYKESVNKYAQGKGERINRSLNIFAEINEMQDPTELDTIILDKIERKTFEASKVKIEKYDIIYKKIFEGGE